MSVGVSVVAQKRLSEKDLAKVRLYNSLYKQGYDIPLKLADDIENFLSVGALFDGDILVPEEGDVVEVFLPGKGDVMYGDGLVIQVSDFPENTVAIRIYGS